jgi:outer membrane protein, adhesin transport system
MTTNGSKEGRVKKSIALAVSVALLAPSLTFAQATVETPTVRRIAPANPGNGSSSSVADKRAPLGANSSANSTNISGISSANPRAVRPVDAALLSSEEQTKARFINMLRSNPEIVTSRINLDAAQYTKDAASAAFYPKISIGANASSSSTVTNRQSTDITVRQPIFTAGRLTAKMKSAETQGTIAEGDFSKTVQDVVLDGFLAHSNLSRMGLLVQASRAAERAVAELLVLEQRRVELGGAGITDAQFAKARYAVTLDRLANYEGQQEEARATYFRYFGAYPEGYSIPELEVTPDMAPKNVDDAVAKALFTNPEIRSNESKITKSRYDYDAESAAQYPSVDLVGIQQFFGETDPFTGKDSDSSVNLRLSYSAFSGGEQVAKVNQAAAAVETRRAQLAAARLRTEESVRFQWGKWIAGMERAKTLRTAYGDSLQVFKNRKRLRDFGRETVIVMLDAQVEYFNVLIAYINAVFDARDASFRLMHAMGQMMPANGSEALWFARFFSKNSERARLEASLKETETIASSPSDAGIAEKLGITVDKKELQEASRFTLTPAQRLELEKGRAQGPKPVSSDGEQGVKPSLRTAPGLDPRFVQ